MKRLLLITCLVGFFASRAAVGEASPIVCGASGCDDASVIDLGSWDYPADTGSGGSAADQLQFLNETVLLAYPNLPQATFGTPNINVSTDPEILAIELDVTGYDYIKLKWANTWHYYYVGGVSESIRFESTSFNKNGKAQALSHYTFFHSVPDGGATLGLLGGALFGLGLFGRRKKS